jgi:hypothetical protein
MSVAPLEAATAFLKKKVILALLVEPETQSARFIELPNDKYLMAEVRRLLGSEHIGTLPRLDIDNKLLFNPDLQSDETVQFGYHFPWSNVMGLGEKWDSTYWGKSLILNETEGKDTTWAPDTLEYQGISWDTRETHQQYLRDLEEYSLRFGNDHPGWRSAEETASLERIAFPEFNDPI